MQDDTDTTVPFRKPRKKQNVNQYWKQLSIQAVFLLTSALVIACLLLLGLKTLSKDTSSEREEQTVPSFEPDTGDKEIFSEEPNSIEQMLGDGYVTNSIPLSYELQLTAREASDAFNVPYTMLLAVMFQESSYQTDAVNYDGTCWGLMQVNEINFERLTEELGDFGVTDIKNNPEDNIVAGAYMLGELLEKYQDENMALMCYSCGEAGARQLFEQGYYSSSYSRAVIQYELELDNAGILPNGK